MKTNLYYPKFKSIKRELWVCVLALISGFFLLSLTASAQKKQPVYGKGGTVPVDDGFEVDANFFSGNRPAFVYASFYSPSAAPALFIPYYNDEDGDDWSGTNGVIPKVNGVIVPGVLSEDGRTIWNIDGNSGNASTVPEQNIFSGTSNKNSDLIGVGQSPYSVKASSGGPQKNDITNVFLHTAVRNDSTWLFFAFEHRSTDGTSYGDLEYNQAGVSLDSIPGSLIGLGPNAQGGRTTDDFILSVDFSGGGNNPTVAARTLLANGTWSNKLVLADKDQFVTVNITDVDAVAPGRAFNGNGSPSNTTTAFQLIEGGVNLTAFGFDDDVCDPEATVTFKTRSSDSFTAELKDLAVVPFSIVPGAEMSALTDVAICPSQAATFIAHVEGEGADPANVNWYHIVGTDTTEITNGGQYSIVADGDSSTLVISNVTAANGGVYLAVLAGATCGNPSSTATLTINSIDAPYVTISEPSICGPATGSITVCNPEVGANYYLIQLDPNDLTDSLYADSVINYASGALTFTGVLPGAGFILRAEKDGCEAVINCDSTDYIISAEDCSGSARVAPAITDPVKDNNVVHPQSDLRQAEQKAEAKALTAYPVPFSDKVTLEFASDKTEHYVISLYDIHGRMIKQLKSGKAKAGEVIRIDVDGKGMVDSMYYARKVSKSGTSTIKLLKKE